MRRKLYPNIRWMTRLFMFSIICLTLSTLALRLTVFGDIPINPVSGQTEEGQELFQFAIARQVHFDGQTGVGNLRIENQDTNNYFMSVSILLPETGQEVFYSGFIRPGESRTEALLQIRPEPGVYEATARITVYHPQTLEPRGSQEREITLQVG